MVASIIQPLFRLDKQALAGLGIPPVGMTEMGSFLMQDDGALRREAQGR